MPQYEQDEYVQGHGVDEPVWINTVATWRAPFDVRGRLARLVLDQHKSLLFRRTGLARASLQGAPVSTV